MAAAGLIVFAAATAARAEPMKIPNFAYTYGLTTARYSLTETATGDHYTGEGTVTGIRAHTPAGVQRLGVLVHNNVFRRATVQGTWGPRFGLTETWREAGPAGSHCRGRQVIRVYVPFAIQLSILPEAERVQARYTVFTALGGHGCGPGLGGRAVIQTFPLSLFMRTRFTLNLHGSTRGDTSAATHSLKWSITLGVVRTGGYTLP